MAFFLLMGLSAPAKLKGTSTPTKTATAVVTATPSRTATETSTATETATVGPTDTPGPTDTALPLPSVPPSPTLAPVDILPYRGAPACPDIGAGHDTSKFHTLWDGVRGCHYDHEHGQNPFVPEVTAAFPDFDLRALLCYVEVGHCNPSSPIENLDKHGGYKWQVNVPAPQGCTVGFEGGTIAIDADVIQFHSFGPQAVELEARNHSSIAVLRECRPDDPADKGYIYVAQLQEFGERCIPYQGLTAPYPTNFSPPWDCASGPYWSAGCIAPLANCAPSRQYILDHNQNVNSVVTSKNTGSGVRPPGSTLLTFLYRSRDNYQVLDGSDLVHPFTWLWVCSSDGGLTYNPVGCRYNNSTLTIHEVKGTIPAAWDGLAGWDTEPEAGRVTAQGFVTRYGEIAPDCTGPSGLDCQPIKLWRAFVGTYSSELSAAKVSNPTPGNTFERDIYFCPNGLVCQETDPGAVPSGWLGPNN